MRSLARGDLEDIARIDRRLMGQDRSAYIAHKLEDALTESAIRISLVARVITSYSIHYTKLYELVGALEVPGGTLGTTIRLNRPLSERHASVKPGPDGFMHYPLNPTDKEHWSAKPNIRNAYRSLVPLAADGPWSQASYNFV